MDKDIPTFPNSGSYRVLVGFQRTGEFQESPQDFSTAGTGQAVAPPKPPEDEKCSHCCCYCFTVCPWFLQRFSKVRWCPAAFSYCFTVCVWFLQCFLKVSVKSCIAPLKVVLGGSPGGSRR